MIVKRSKTALIALLAIAAIFSCKKEEETVVIPSLEGSTRFKNHIPSYVIEGESVTFSPRGAVHPGGGSIGYYYTVSPKKETKADTIKLNNTGDTTIVFSGEMGKLETYSIVCTAFASGYSPISGSAHVTVVRKGLDGSGSITGIDQDRLSADKMFTDARDGKKYYFTTIGNLDWMILNLAYAGSADATKGVACEGEEALRDIFGGYYSYNEAADNICPEGWRLPTSAEWDALPEDTGKMMANVSFNGSKMWTFWPEVKISNETGLSIIPSGQANLGSMVFSGIRENAVFWTSDEDPDNDRNAIIKYILDDTNTLYTASVDKASFGASVRCVR